MKKKTIVKTLKKHNKRCEYLKYYTSKANALRALKRLKKSNNFTQPFSAHYITRSGKMISNIFAIADRKA